MAPEFLNPKLNQENGPFRQISLHQTFRRPGRAVNFSSPDLTKFPPRSPRTRLGGFVHLPRLIDKARATVAGTNGDFHYDCPVDAHFWAFTGLKPAAFLKEVIAGKGDGQLLAYVLTQAKPRRSASEIAAWSAWFEGRAPSAVDGREFFNTVHQKNAAHREDISTWFDWLELDDYVTFGGKA